MYIAPARSAGMVFAGAEFGARPEGGKRLPQSNFVPLPATVDEARVVSESMGITESAVFTGARATEAALRGVAGPRVLHIASHGFFERGTGGDGLDPLLDSGLALSGVNARTPETNSAADGLLTAMDVVGLDLVGTELAVLSACETGVGTMTAGQGVYGMRRALSMAGSQSQLLSLWQVDDDSTAALFSALYRRLAAGEGRSAALQSVQVALLDGRLTPPADYTARSRGSVVESGLPTEAYPGWTHPYFWAAFTLSGAGGPLSTGSSDAALVNVAE